MSWLVWGHQILSFTSVSIAENKGKFSLLFCTLSKKFHLATCKTAALHEKTPEFGCNRVGIVRPTFNLMGAKLFNSTRCIN